MPFDLASFDFDAEKLLDPAEGDFGALASDAAVDAGLHFLDVLLEV